MFSNNIKTQKDAPYGDDFQENVEGPGKNYTKILFRPGRSVQARELTQMQTLLQSQINKFGKSIYKEGTPVIDGQCTIDNNVVRLQVGSAIESVVGITAVIAAALVDKQAILYLGSSISTATVTAVVIGTQIESGLIYLYVKYSSATSSDSRTFLANTATVKTNLNITDTIIVPITTIGLASRISVNRGVYFIAGAFVENAAQSVFIKHDDSPEVNITGFVLFSVIQSVATSITDNTLLDNSAGTTNYYAPGADRHKIDLVLEFNKLTTAVGKEYIQLLKIDAGKVFIAQRTEYSKLDDLLAQRTHEESGNYTVNPFLIDIKEKSKALDPLRGISTVNTDKDNFIVGVEPGIAYVDGYRVQLQERQDITVAKPRTEASDVFSSTLSSFSINYGSYIIGTILTSSTKLPEIENRRAVYCLLSVSDSASPITSEHIIGLCYVTSVEYYTNTEVRVFISDITLRSNKYIRNAKYLKLTNISTGIIPADTDSVTISTDIFTLQNTGGFTLFDSDLDKLVFPLPYVNVKTLVVKGTSANLAFSYTARQRFTVTATASSTIQISATTGTFTSNTANDYIVYRTNNTKGQLFPSTIQTNGNNATLTFASNFVNGDAVHVITHITIANNLSSFRKKILRAGQTVFGMVGNTFNDGNITSTGTGTAIDQGTVPSVQILPLLHSDIAKIVRIRRTQTGGGALVEQTDFENYVLDSGQRDTHYAAGSIKYIAYYATVAPGIVIDYLWFEHVNDYVNDYFIRDSYGASDATNATINGVNYSSADLIPSYQGNNLSDCVDFRRSQVIPSNTSGAYLEPNSIITTAVQVWMPRIDVLVVNKNSQFKVITGETAISPATPKIPVHSMALYTFKIPGYTKSVKDIVISMIDSQRYTMKNIGELETRISNLEYYTTLSLLETQTSQKSILSTTGGERFKNGFFADGFIGSDMGNSEYPGYLCAVDHANQILRPFYTITDGRIILYTNATANLLSSTSTTDQTHIRLISDLLTLPYTTEILINQPYASGISNVNPFNVFTWNGILELSPSSDNWIDVIDLPAITTNDTNAYDGMVNALTSLGKIGTVWNAWTSSTWGSWAQTGKYEGRQWKRERFDTKNLTATTTTLGFTDRKVITGSTSAISLIPFIRSRKVQFKASLLKPSTQVYAFFDNVNIDNFVQVVDSATEIIRSGASNEAVQLFRMATVHPNKTAVLKTNDSGTIIGNFIIPNNDTLKFKSGERIFKLCDSPTNTSIDITTTAQTIYSATGTLHTIQNHITSTRVIAGIVSNSVTTIGTTSVVTEWIDPLAQSFMIGDIPGGCFITDVDLYFRAKPYFENKLPVTLHIVECSNGTPTQNKIPGSTVSILSDNVQLSDNATLSTNFKFTTPLYLKSGIEYAMVIMSMSNKYEVWVAQLGEIDVTTSTLNVKNRISSNPYAGVFFMSQNASTWTPDQTKDLKFTMRRAKFVINSEISIEFKCINNQNSSGIDLEDKASLINLSTEELNFPETSLTWQIKFGNDDATAIRPNDNYILPALKTFNSTNLVTCIATLKSTSEYLSPIVDLERLSLKKIRNEINAFQVTGTTVNQVFTDQTAQSDVGILAAKARYVTPIIHLNNPADQLNIYMDISLPNYTDVRVYAKLRTSTADYNSIVWERVSLMPGTIIPISNDQEQFNEVRFAILDTDDTSKSFNSFMVKIEMLANDNSELLLTATTLQFQFTALTPLIKNLRIIAST